MHQRVRSPGSAKSGETSALPADGAFKVAGRYLSKRNKVLKLRISEPGSCGRFLVLKEHATAGQARSEYDSLTKLHAAGIRVPKPISLEGRCLYLQHLVGVLLTDIIERDICSANWTEDLARWYQTLHTTTASGDGTSWLKTDNNLRNFLYVDNEFYGLDFEQVSRGDPAQDIGQMCAFILANRPAFTAEKVAAARKLARRYLVLNSPVSPKKIQTELLTELGQMARRRTKEKEHIRAFIDSTAARTLV